MSTDAVSRRTVFIAALFGATAVLCGAFAAHALDARLDERALGWWQTAADYHARHALALLGVGLLPTRRTGMRRAAALCFAGGILLFAGSLYAMALSGVTALGVITPIGGLALIAGWLLSAYAALGIGVGAVGSRTDR